MLVRNPVATIAFLGFALQAHEIGNTRVSVSFQNGRTYDIEIVTNAAALADKLTASTGLPGPAGPDPAALESLLESADAQFRKRLKLLFDSSEARPAIAYSVVPAPDAGSAAATIRLTGQIQPDARTFTWSYSWTFATYSLTIRSAPNSPPVTQ